MPGSFRVFELPLDEEEKKLAVLNTLITEENTVGARLSFPSFLLSSFFILLVLISYHCQTLSLIYENTTHSSSEIS